MSSPAVIFGRPVLPSLMGRSSFLGRSSPYSACRLKGTAYGGAAFSSHLRRTPYMRTSQKLPSKHSGLIRPSEGY